MGGNVAHMGERKGEVYTGIWWGNLRERNHLGDPGVDGSVIRCESSVTRKKREREKDGISTPPLSTVRCRPYSSSLF